LKRSWVWWCKSILVHMGGRSGIVSLRPVWATERVLGYPGWHNETLSQNKRGANEQYLSTKGEIWCLPLYPQFPHYDLVHHPQICTLVHLSSWQTLGQCILIKFSPQFHLTSFLSSLGRSWKLWCHLPPLSHTNVHKKVNRNKDLQTKSAGQFSQWVALLTWNRRPYRDVLLCVMETFFRHWEVVKAKFSGY
jgi:hypothetical protein